MTTEPTATQWPWDQGLAQSAALDAARRRVRRRSLLRAARRLLPGGRRPA